MHKDAEILFQFVASHVHRIIQFRHKIIPRIGCGIILSMVVQIVNRITDELYLIY